MLTRKCRGISLIEILIVLSIVGILLEQGIPAMAGFAASARIRTAAEGYSNGIAQARAEAVRLNTNVEFLTSAGKWQVRRVIDSFVLHQAAGIEATSDVTTTVTPTNATRITFDQYGRIVATSPVDGTSAIRQVDFDVSYGAGLGTGRRALRVLVQTGGAVKMCDPLASTTDPRACV
jgi:type IV fimbrial biogenesis protein FimT